MPTIKVDAIVQSVDRLQPLPTSVTRVLSTLESPNSNARMVSEMIGLDQALAASVLSIANSAALGYAPVCTNLNDAVMRLGFRRVKTVIMGAATSNELTRPLSGYRLKSGELWNHSVAAAMACQWLSQVFSYSDPEEAYVGGLLHDIGKVLLDQYVRMDYLVIVDTMRRGQVSLWQAEEHLFGIDHARIGGMMAKRWNFPSGLIDAIQYHHAPSLAMENEKLAAIANVANSFITRQETGMTDPYGAVIHPEAMRILRIDEGRAKVLKEQMFQNFRLQNPPV